jgi:hypothetical protein
VGRPLHSMRSGHGGGVIRCRAPMGRRGCRKRVCHGVPSHCARGRSESAGWRPDAAVLRQRCSCTRTPVQTSRARLTYAALSALGGGMREYRPGYSRTRGRRCPGPARRCQRSLEKVEGGVHGHEEVAKRRTAVQAISPVTARRDATPPRALTHDKV